MELENSPLNLDKLKKTEEDDTLSLESDRSQGYINEKAEDWPSWTVEESNNNTTSQITKNRNPEIVNKME